MKTASQGLSGVLGLRLAISRVTEAHVDKMLMRSGQTDSSSHLAQLIGPILSTGSLAAPVDCCTFRPARR